MEKRWKKWIPLNLTFHVPKPWAPGGLPSQSQLKKEPSDASAKEDRQAKRFTIRVFILAVAIAAWSLMHFIATLGTERNLWLH